MTPIERYREFVWRNAIGGQRTLEKRAMYFMIEAAEFANEVKRIDTKDDGFYITPDRRSKLVEELGDSLFYFFLLMDNLNVDLEEVMYRNIIKLEERYGQGDADPQGAFQTWHTPVPDVLGSDRV